MSIPKQEKYFRIRNQGKLLIVLMILSFIGLSLHASSYVMESKANCFAVTHGNTVYVGTAKGLYCFKERELVQITSVGDKAITSICAHDSVLYLGTKNGELFQFQSDELALVGRYDNEITCIQVAGSSIMLGTNGSGLYIIDSSSTRHINSANSVLDDNINAIVFDYGKLILATDNGLYTLTPGSTDIRSMVNPEQLADPLITTVFMKSAYEIEFGTSLGYVYQYNLSQEKLITIGHLMAKVNFLNQNEIGTQNGLYDRNKQFDENEEGAYLSSLLDAETNRWYLKTNELIFSPHVARVFSIKGANAIRNVHSMVSNKQDLYFTPDIGLFSYFADSSFRYRQLSTLTKHIDITSFFFQKDTLLWIGTMGDGMYRCNPKTDTYQRITLDEHISSAGILSISGNETELYVSTLNGAWHSSNPLQHPIQFSSIEDNHNIKRSYVYQIRVDSKGRIWLATEGKGLLLLDKGILSSFNPDGGIKAKSFYSIEEDTEGNLYFASDHQGLYIWMQGKLFNLNSKSGLHRNNILGIKFCQGYLVVLHDSSYTLVHTTSLQSTFGFFPRNYHAELNSVTCYRGSYLVGCDLGILSIPQLDAKAAIYPRPFFSSILCNNFKVKNRDKEFAYDQNNFVFHLSYQFNNPQVPLYFRYKLIGYNSAWVVTNDKMILFNLLNPGRYTLRYQVANNPSFQFANESNYSFTIKPPFWTQIWFWVVSAFSIFAIIYYIVRHRIKQNSLMKEMEQQRKLAEFDALKSQVNPHFLFNSFNSLIQIIEDDKEQAIEYTTLLSDLYRNILSSRDKDMILLEEEVQTMQDYIRLHQINLGENLDLQVCQFEREAHYLCPLTLQLLAENAVKHNTINSANKLRLEVIVEGDYLIVKNNINKKITSAPGEKIGLQNIQKRYQNMSKLPVVIESTEYYFIVKIPLLVK